MLAAKAFPDFITVTCKDKKFLLHNDRFKRLITDSLRFLSKNERVYVYAFVIMSNHFHLIWQMRGDWERSRVQRDFLKYTSQQILRILKTDDPTMHELLKVEAFDRDYQVWEEHSLSVPLYTDKFFFQKFGYIHRNPVDAGLCKNSWEYKYSSARYYTTGEKNWDFLVHYDG